MSLQISRRQHHVWRYYLEPWTSDGQLFCRDGDRIFKLNPRNAAVETDFYKLNNLTKGDLALLNGMAETARPHARKAMESFIQMLSPEHRLQAWIEATGDRAAAEEMMRQDFIQLEEKYHSDIEADAQETLNCLRSGDVQTLPDGPELRHFCYFLGVQMFRTKSMKERVLARMSQMEPSEYLSPNSWNIQSHFYAANLGSSIYADRAASPIRVLKNNTSCLFITGDQPVINIHGRGDGRPPEYAAIHYPITPRLAVFVDDSNHPLSLHASELTEDQVRSLNAHITRLSFRQIFGATRTCLGAI
ncbi:DUF4238 domain-containing protein [Variovorax sp. RB2P76]|uniref:DUF4238 domain-containing protein n=1 Tax=Variovorax sp. RB2P76 TaxID=3443736 RepID=UPI003F47217D